MTCGPGQEPITKTELAIVRGLEKILSPLIVLAIAGLVGFSFQIKETVAQLRADHELYGTKDHNIEEAIEELDTKQDLLLRQQYDLERDLTAVSTHQDHFKEEIQGLKKQGLEVQRQNSEILQILRSQAR